MTEIGDTVPASEDDEQDAVIGGQYGRYGVRGLLGSGGMGVVLEAYDPDLDRAVALKLLHPSRHSDDAADRMMREARAMAKVAHPNVVTVYQVGRSGDRIFLAMELVEGSTLRAWLQHERSRRDILAMFVGAGRGLVAAHEAGLVHRDFKPDNVLIGGDGRPRVTDFGLVALSGDGHDNGALITGTPAYMAPEQWRGGEVGPATDQFAFCVALWEALRGSRPYAGATANELSEAVCTGAIVTGRGELPSWLDAALRRGLAVDVRERWPSLAELLDLLERRGRRRWPIIAAASGAGAVLATAGVLLFGSSSPDACPAPDARVAAVWGATRRSTIDAELVRHGETAAGAVAARHVDSELERWRAMHVDACEATRVRGEQSDSLLDLRMRCLDGWLAELDDTLTLVATSPDREALDHALGALYQLPSLAPCADTQMLARTNTPIPAGQSAAVARLDAELRSAEVDRRADRYVGLLARVRTAVTSARATGYAPILVRALKLQADVETVVDEHAAAGTTLRELVQLAASIRDDYTETRAWNHLIYVLGFQRGESDQALGLEPAATAALARAGNPVELRVEQLMHLAQVKDLQGARAPEAIEHLKQALTLIDAEQRVRPSKILEERRIDILAELGNAYSVTGDRAAQEASLRAALAGYRDLFGADSLDQSMVLNNLGEVLRREGKPEDGLLALRDAARIVEAKTGESQRLALNLLQVSSALGDLDRWPEALEASKRSLAIARSHLGEQDPTLATYVFGHALTLSHSPQRAEARAHYDLALSLFARGGEDNLNLPITLYNRGELAFDDKRFPEARADYERALALFEKLRDPKASMLLYPLVGLARVHVAQGAFPDARRVLERALAIEPDGADVGLHAAARAWLGRVTDDRVRGRALEKAGRDALASAPATDATAKRERMLLEALPPRP